MEVARVKFNNYRRPEFQTATVILEGDGLRHVVKRGIVDECAPHIDSLKGKYEALRSTYRRFEVIPPTIVKSEAHFEFDQNVSLLQKLCNLLRMGDEEGFELELMRFAGAVGDAAKQTSGWWKHAGFQRIFGEVAPESQKSMLCVEPSNIDLVFSNVHVRGNEDVPYSMFDYEWTFDFAVPLEYVIWRALNRFTTTLRATTHQNWTIDRLCRTVGVDLANKPMFEAMESRFQVYVYGKEVFQNTPDHVDAKTPIVDFQQIATWMAANNQVPLRGVPVVKVPFWRKALAPVMPFLRLGKRTLVRLTGR